MSSVNLLNDWHSKIDCGTATLSTGLNGMYLGLIWGLASSSKFVGMGGIVDTGSNILTPKVVMR